MAAPKLTSAEMPDWPRLLPQPMAAAYLGISEGLFMQGVDAGLWPRPLRIERRVLWDRRKLDGKVDMLSGLITVEQPAVRLAPNAPQALPKPPKRKHILR